MIIKNNFNSKSSNPIDNYQEIGKGSHSLDKELEREKNGLIRENMNNNVIRDLMEEEKEDIDDTKEDKWDFFR